MNNGNFHLSSERRLVCAGEFFLRNRNDRLNDGPIGYAEEDFSTSKRRIVTFSTITVENVAINNERDCLTQFAS